MTEEMKINRLRYINNAIDGWKDKLDGIYGEWELKRYPPDFCKEQIEYFEKMKKEHEQG